MVLQVICFGMSLPLSEHDTIRDCVHVYCEWLSALHPIPKICVPRPVCEDPNLYARKMICHFHNLFVPRKGEGKLHSRLMFCNIFIGSFAQIQGCYTALIHTCTIYCHVININFSQNFEYQKLWCLFHAEIFGKHRYLICLEK